MQTTRINFRSSAPTTDFSLGADIVAQSQQGNYSVVRLSITAINRGNTGSYDNNGGEQYGDVQGYGDIRHNSTLPSGYGNGATRWDDVRDVGVGHDGNGYKDGVNLRQAISGWFYNDQTVWFSGFPRIPKRPSTPGTPSASNVLPTSMTLSWGGSGDDRGSGIDHYLLRRWDNPEGSGNYTDDIANNTSRTITGLTPGKEYRWAVYAHNGSGDNNGYSDMSGAMVARTLSGMWIKVSGTWKRAAPYLKVNNIWRAVSVFIKNSDVWKRGG